MPKKSVFCIATSEFQAATVVDRLRNADFSNHDISALFPDKSGTRDFAHSKGTKAPEGVGAVGEIAGALIGMGIPEFEAQRFEAKVKAGGILISVHTADADEVQLAEQIFQEEDVDEIAVAGEAAAFEQAATR
jgi:hypothetical protein